MFAHKAVMSHANELGTKKIYLTITIIGALQQSAVTRSAPQGSEPVQLYYNIT